MDETIQKFEQYLNRRYPGSNTAKSYVSDLRVFNQFVDELPREVSKSDVAEFVEDQLAQGLATTTVNRRLASLHHFFEFLADEADDDTWSNPVVWRQQRVKEGKPLPRDISDTDVERLFACITHPRDRLMFELMCGAGLRVGEVAALSVSDFIPAGAARAGFRLRVLGKGQKERMIPLTQPLAGQCAAWLTRRPKVQSHAFFITRRQQGFSERGIQERLTHYAKQSGVKVTCHQLRHTFGRRMAESEMPMLSLSKLMGHEKVTTTQLYTAGAAVDIRADYEAAMSRLDAERPGSPLFPPASFPAHDVPPSPEEPDAGDGGAAAAVAERAEASLDVSRFWEGLPTWLTDLLAEHIARQQRRWKPSQVRHHTRNRLYALRSIWLWLIGKRQVDSFETLTRRDVEAYIDVRTEAGIAASTLNRELRILGALLRFVERQGYVVSPGVFRIVPLKEGKPLPRSLAEEAYRRLEAHILSQTAMGTRDDYLNRACFYLLAHQGLRVGELCDLRLRDVDLAGQRLTVREGKGKRDRCIPLSATTVRVLGDYLAVRGAAATNHLLLFRHRPVTPSLVQARLRRYGKGVDVHVSPHRLRHTLATRLLNVGTDIVSIQHLLGHEKLTTTQIYARVYDATVERDFRQAMARLEAGRDRPAGGMQTGSLSSSEELFSHIHESVSDQALNCV